MVVVEVKTTLGLNQYVLTPPDPVGTLTLTIKWDLRGGDFLTSHNSECQSKEKAVLQLQPRMLALFETVKNCIQLLVG